MPKYPHQNCYGYTRGRNIRENAEAHLGSSRLLKTDIENFFPSITKNKLKVFFINLGVDEHIAKILSDFLTVDDYLALGLPTSPAVANAMCYQLDIELEALGQLYSSVYTRYADDITFSSSDILPTVHEVSKLLEKHDFLISKRKTRHIKVGQNFYVTGLSISDKLFVHAPRKMKKILRQELYFSEKHGLNEHIDHLGIMDFNERQRHINHLDGKVKYIAFHEPKIANKIVPQWQNILIKSGEEASFESKNVSGGVFEFYIDETEFDLEKNSYLALGMSASQYQHELDEVTNRIVEDHIANPLSDGDISAVRKNRMHYADATEDLKKQYVDALTLMPFNGYIVFGQIKNNLNYKNVYLFLLKNIIKRRLIAADGRLAVFSFESTDKVSESDIQKVVNDAHSELKVSNNRRPKKIHIRFVDKGFDGVAVPDFILGVFRKYMISGALVHPPQREHLMFERIRDKIRVIINADTGVEYTRRNPLGSNSIVSKK